MSAHDPAVYVDPADEVWVVRAQALVEAVAEYERNHPAGTPCLAEALNLMVQVIEP